MSQFGKLVAPGIIRFERLLPGAIDDVWAYLTESEKRGRWLAKGEMDLQVGGRVDLHFFHAQLSPVKEKTPEKYGSYESGVHIYGYITRCSPPTLLSFTWDEASGEKSEVTFELAKKSSEVLLTVTHRYQGHSRIAMIGFASGWHAHLYFLESCLKKQVPGGFWEVHTRLEKVYEKRL